MTTESKEVALQPSRLPIPPQLAKQYELEPGQWRVLVEQIFPSAKTPEAVLMALAYCHERKLDIYKKPVHIVPMWDSSRNRNVETVWPSINEIRTTAHRTGEYAGCTEVEHGPAKEVTFEGSAGYGNKKKDYKKKITFPEWSKITFYRMVKGVKCPFPATVRWLETYATIGKTDVPNEVWGKRPYGQPEKCVEAAALRMAFPEEVGNSYAAEEMSGREIIDGSIAGVAPELEPPAPPDEPEAAPDPDEVVIEESEQEPVSEEPEQPPEPTGDPGPADQVSSELLGDPPAEIEEEAPEPPADPEPETEQKAEPEPENEDLGDIPEAFRREQPANPEPKAEFASPTQEPGFDLMQYREGVEDEMAACSDMDDLSEVMDRVQAEIWDFVPDNVKEVFKDIFEANKNRLGG